VSAGEFDEFMVHAVTVDTKSGEDAWGNTTAATSDPVPCLIDDTVGLTRTASGDTVTSTTTLWITDLTKRDLFAPESIVHLPDRDATVLRVTTADSGQLGLPDHLQVVLT
jgi:hypothetical protein